MEEAEKCRAIYCGERPRELRDPEKSWADECVQLGGTHACRPTDWNFGVTHRAGLEVLQTKGSFIATTPLSPPTGARLLQSEEEGNVAPTPTQTRTGHTSQKGPKAGSRRRVKKTNPQFS